MNSLGLVFARIRNFFTPRRFTVLFVMLALLCLFTLQALAVRTAVTTPVQKIRRAGVVPTPVQIDGVNGNSIPLVGGEFIRINNTGGGSLTCIFRDQYTNIQGYTNDASTVCGNNTVTYIGPFVKRRWADASGNLIVDYTGTTGNALIEVERLPFGEPESATK